MNHKPFAGALASIIVITSFFGVCATTDARTVTPANKWMTPAEKWMTQYQSCLPQANSDDVAKKIGHEPARAASWDKMIRPKNGTMVVIDEKHMHDKIMNDQAYEVLAVEDASKPNSYYVQENYNEGGFDIMIASPTAPPGKSVPRKNVTMHTELGIHLGSTKNEILSLLGRGIVTHGCGLESWTYPSSEGGMNTHSMIYIFQGNTVIEIKDVD